MVSPDNIGESLAELIAEVAAGATPGRTLADWSYEQWLRLQEGDLADDSSPKARLLRDLLYEIFLDWETRASNAYAAGGPEGAGRELFPADLLTAWSSRLMGA